jgi:hypothetical protein
LTTPNLCVLLILTFYSMAGGNRRNRDKTRTPAAPVRGRIVWDIPRTHRLIDWLEQNPIERHKLFSDSTQDARAEGRSRHVGKTSKSSYYSKIAKAVFSVDADPVIRSTFDSTDGDDGRFCRAVENRVST